MTHAELDHRRSLPLWAERDSALLFVHSVLRDEPNNIFAHWFKNIDCACSGAILRCFLLGRWRKKAERIGGSRKGERVSPCYEMRPGVSDLNVPLPLSYVPVQKTKGMPRRLQEEFQNGTEKTEMMLGGLNPFFSASHGNPDIGVNSPLCGWNYQRLAFDRRSYGSLKRGNDADRTKPFDTLMANICTRRGFPRTRYSDDRP
ncbi:uncharacterized protein B0T23DRAFT_411048 [Neurospora hispaniola]|uniref:Uncharacterized protein n=1 Tax=Neurospora hispaniola TaxID=588809 RepID=A0AAJ0IDG4_9PEZI|nr:hypothetical protein B0T23DRAFT_411048 [Neurospora hispaniola]